MTPEALALALIRPRRPSEDQPKPDARLVERGFNVALHFRGPPGSSRRALLVHGWEREHRDLDTVAGALVKTGIHCVLPDLPAHGGSAGETMMIPEAADALATIDAAHGPFDLCVAHSVGAAVALVALANGLRARRVAFLAPPRNYVHQLSLAARTAGAPQPLIDAALNVLRRRCPRLDDVDSIALARRLGVPGLIVVAGRDQVLDPEDGRGLAAAWPRSRLIDLPDASHRSVLKDAAVLEAIVALANEEDP